MPKNPNILGIKVHSLYNPEPDKYVSTVDAWRVHRPLSKLKEKGWNADVKGKWLQHGKIEDIGMQRELTELGETYDIIYMSYLREQPHYLLLVWLREKMGMKVVMDIDDDLFNISEWNPAREYIHPGSKDHFNLWSIVRDVEYISTTTEHLAKKFRKLRPDKPPESVVVLPNYASTGFYPLSEPDNGKDVLIGWQGSAHHHGDLHTTGFMRALEKVMHAHKNTRFESVGHPIMDTNLPAKRRKTTLMEKPGLQYWKKLFPKLHFDIGCAPLEDSEFNKGKSNIKWQEYAIMGAATVASDVGPYKEVIDHGRNGLLAKNEGDWEKHLTYLINNPKERKQMAIEARKDFLDKYTLEKNYTVYEDFFRKIYGKTG